MKPKLKPWTILLLLVLGYGIFAAIPTAIDPPYADGWEPLTTLTNTLFIILSIIVIVGIIKRKPWAHVIIIVCCVLSIQYTSSELVRRAFYMAVQINTFDHLGANFWVLIALALAIWDLVFIKKHKTK